MGIFVFVRHQVWRTVCSSVDAQNEAAAESGSRARPRC
jgi:hypothetical protein